MTGPNTLAQILQDHAKFLEDVHGIPITGISPVHMTAKRESGQSTLQDSITDLEGVISVEQTRDTQNMGKWLVLTTSAQEATVLEKVTGMLQQLRLSEETSGFLTVGKQFVRPQVSKMNRVHSYAEALTQKFPVAHSRGNPPKVPQEASPLPKERIKRVDRPVTPTKPSPNLAQVGHDLKLAEAMFQKRITDMERKWQEVEDRIQKKQTEQNASLEAQLAEQRSQVTTSSHNSVAQYVDNTLADFTKLQSQTLSEMEDKLLQMVDKKLDEKADQLSIDVANHVTSRLLEVLNQTGITRPAGVTQDSLGTPLLPIPEIKNQHTDNGLLPHKLGSPTVNSPPPGSALSNQPNTHRSSHDTNYERDTGIK